MEKERFAAGAQQPKGTSRKFQTQKKIATGSWPTLEEREASQTLLPFAFTSTKSATKLTKLSGFKMNFLSRLLCIPHCLFILRLLNTFFLMSWSATTLHCVSRPNIDLICTTEHNHPEPSRSGLCFAHVHSQT